MTRSSCSRSANLRSSRSSSVSRLRESSDGVAVVMPGGSPRSPTACGRPVPVLSRPASGGPQLGAEVAQDAAEDPGHLHLGDPDLLADLRLGPVLAEPEVEDAAVPLVEAAYG